MIRWLEEKTQHDRITIAVRVVTLILIVSLVLFAVR